MLWSQMPVRFDGACTNAPGSCALDGGVDVAAVGVVAGAGLAVGPDDDGAAAVDTAVASNAGQL